MMKNITRGHSGFTFVEMVLVVALMSLISVSLYQTIVNGISVWERSHAFKIEEDIAIALDKMKRDLRNTLFYSSIPFSGRRQAISIPTMIKVQDKRLVIGGEASLKDQIGLVEYYYDSSAGMLYRRQSDYGQSSGSAAGKESVVASSLDDVKFSYFYSGQDTPTSIRISEDSGMPIAVLVELTLKEEGGGRRKVEKLIGIPVGGGS